MTLTAFKATLARETPPDGLSPALSALWHQARGDWARAHKIVQGEHDKASQWVHAHLHRAEGDLGNARYWYGKIDKPASTAPLEREWDEIARALLDAR